MQFLLTYTYVYTPFFQVLATCIKVLWIQTLTTTAVLHHHDFPEGCLLPLGTIN